MREERISSRSNPLCLHLRKLACSRSYREQAGEFLCDSPKLLQEALLWGAELTALLYTPEVRLPPLTRLPARLVQVTQSVMGSVSPMQTPQGVVFSCRLPKNDPPERLEPGRYLLLDGVQDPGNVGTILRSADAFGWRVFLLSGCADLYNPKTIRSAMGVHFRAPIWRAGLDQAAALVRDAGLTLYAAALREETLSAEEADLTRCAVIVGSEGRGVSPEALELCDQGLKIPMDPRCESLNAAVAAGILLWEGFRPHKRRPNADCVP